MNDLKSLERRMRLCEAIHLVLMAWCISLSIALLFKEDDQIYRLLWALGVAIPVSLIRVICLYVKKIPLRFALTIGLFAATMAVTSRDYHFVYYALACLPITISGLFVPRNKGSLVLTVPRLAYLLIAFLPYGIGIVSRVPLLSGLAVVISALTTINYFFYLNQSRLLNDIRMSINTEVSVSSMVRQNRKVVALFLAAGVLVLAAIPFILRAVPQETEQFTEAYEIEATPKPTINPQVPRDYKYLQTSKEIDLGFIPFVIAFLLMPAPLVALAGLIYFIIYLIGLIEGKKKHKLPDVSETMTIEKLESDSETSEKERLYGYEKKIRRRYEKLIKSRVGKETRLAPLTPTELEYVAEIEGLGADTIHDIYRQTRYSEEHATREGYVAFMEAVRSLQKPSRSEDKTERK